MAKVSCVDISEFQQGINFNKMKNDGIKAVIIRAGYGRESSQKDSMFESHYKNAKSENMMIGVYWYSYADSVIREIVNGVFRVAIGVIVAILSATAFFGFILWLFTL